MKTRYQKGLWVLLGVVLSTVTGTAFAASTATDIAGMASMIETSLTPLINLIVASCYLGGAGFCAAGIFKFKAHKDNPTQVPVGTPIMLLFVGVALLFLPTIINMMASSFGLSGGTSAFNYSGGSL